MTDNVNPMFKKTEYTSLSKPVEPVFVPSGNVAGESREKRSFRWEGLLVEILVTVAVIGILVAVSIPAMITLTNQ